MTNKNVLYEVLSPWAEADLIPLKGLTAPRITNLAGKKIGMFVNDKRAAPPVRTVLERKLQERFPTCETSWYDAQGQVLQGGVIPEYEEWLNTVDAVVLAVGD
jgi:hypothetical protein